MTKHKEKLWYTKADLKALGFTPRLIADLLPAPEEKAGVLYRRSPKTAVWRKADVEAAMRAFPFILHQAEVNIRIERISMQELESRHARCVWKVPFSPRWCVNYIRHELTDYDETLAGLKEQPVKETEAYVKYKVALLVMIGEIYPNLSDEIEAQIRRTIDKIPEEHKHVARHIRIR